MIPKVDILADSISPEGVRLTTFQVTTWRFILAEFNTHRTLSRNSASSRAIPFARQADRVLLDPGPAFPVEWPAEQKGMQGGAPLTHAAMRQAEHQWAMAARDAVKYGCALRGLGPEAEEKLHKSVVNRLLEPFMEHTIVCTATAWENFFHQRCSPLAQPEIRVTAEAMQALYREHQPTRLVEGEWHLPYIDAADIDQVGYGGKPEYQENAIGALCAASAARCARVSYLTQDGKRDMEADLILYERLVTADPPHWSPLEHVATPWALNTQRGEGIDFMARSGIFLDVETDHLPKVGNLLGWRSLRTTVEAERGVTTYR